MSPGDPSSSLTPDSHHAFAFPPTLWSVVLGAKSEDPAKAEEAIRTLCAIYREPVTHWLQRRGYNQDAEDLAHGFVEFLLERNRLQGFERTDAKFRSFLLTCLRGFLKDQRVKDSAGKRGGGIAPISLDEPEAVEVGGHTEQRSGFDREFALAAHRGAMTRLAEEYERKGQSPRLQELRRFLFGKDGEASYSEVAGRLGMSSGSVKKAVFDLRERYFDRFRAEVAQTVSPEAMNDELRYLFTLLAETEVVDDP